MIFLTLKSLFCSYTRTGGNILLGAADFSSFQKSLNDDFNGSVQTMSIVCRLK